MHTLADGGIGAIGALFQALVVIFVIAVVAVVGFALIVAWGIRHARPGPARPFWLRDRSIPPGLRVLTLLQAFAAIPCTFLASLGLLMPSDGTPWKWYVVGLNVVLAAGFCLTANGYVRGDRRLGLHGGCALGGLMLLHAAVVVVSPWPPTVVTGVVVLVGVGIPLVLLARYRAFFVARTPACRKCGYDLHAAAHERCPECGREIETRRAA